MPSNKRQDIKRTLEGVKNRAETNRDILIDYANLFLKDHPDYADIMFKLAKHFDDVLVPVQALIDII